MEERQSLLQNLHQDLEDVLVIMEENVSKARERGENLEELDHRADELLKCSRRFAKTTKNLTGNQHWRNTTLKVICCAVFFTVVLVVLGIVITATRKHWI